VIAPLNISIYSRDDDGTMLLLSLETKNEEEVEGRRDGEDIYRLPGNKPLELLLAIPDSIAAAPTDAWVRRDASGLFEPP
jgi:hypothetical protein